MIPAAISQDRDEHLVDPGSEVYVAAAFEAAGYEWFVFDFTLREHDIEHIIPPTRQPPRFREFRKFGEFTRFKRVDEGYLSSSWGGGALLGEVVGVAVVTVVGGGGRCVDDACDCEIDGRGGGGEGDDVPQRSSRPVWGSRWGVWVAGSRREYEEDEELGGVGGGPWEKSNDILAVGFGRWGNAGVELGGLCGRARSRELAI